MTVEELKNISPTLMNSHTVTMLPRQHQINSPTPLTAMLGTPTMNFQADLLVPMDTHLTMNLQQLKDLLQVSHLMDFLATTRALILVTEYAPHKIIEQNVHPNLQDLFHIVV